MPKKKKKFLLRRKGKLENIFFFRRGFWEISGVSSGVTKSR